MLHNTECADCPNVYWIGVYRGSNTIWGFPSPFPPKKSGRAVHARNSPPFLFFLIYSVSNSSHRKLHQNSTKPSLIRLKMVGHVQRAREVVGERVPQLRKTPWHTKSSALHLTRYNGPLAKWSTFEQEVRDTCQQQPWSSHTSTVALRPKGSPGPHNIAIEQYVVGDEAGVRGRFQQNVAHVVGAIFGSQGLNLAFGDLKSVASSFDITPDMIIMNMNAEQPEIKAVGEIKSPWVSAHFLEDINETNKDVHDTILRKQIGQLAKYMKCLQVKYAFISTYDQQVFLKQELIEGQWGLQFSPVISDTTANQTTLTVRQCFFFLGLEAGNAPQTENGTPEGSWCT